MKAPEYCSCCGGKLVVRQMEDRPRPVCTSCGAVSYMNPAPASAVVIVQDGKVLLVRRAMEPRRGLWSLPAGFVEIDETVRECAVREAKEETGLEVALDGLVDVATVFDDPRCICLLVVFSGRALGGELRPGDDASEAGFFGANELPPIAFKTHARIIEQVLEETGS